MSKAILLSIKPKWLAKILNGEKTIEIRKTCPKQLRGDTPIKPEPIDVYLYCSKDSKTKLSSNSLKYYVVDNKDYKNYLGNWNGKVVAKFTLRKIKKVSIWDDELETETLKPACLDFLEFDKYTKGQVGYAWHIEDLVIFDKPKELSEFKHCTEKTCIYGKCHKYMHCLKPLTKAPQSYCYVEYFK